MQQKVYHRRSQKAGLPPGSPIYIGIKQAQATNIMMINYDENTFDVTQAATVAKCAEAKDQFHTTWINVTGLKDTKTISALCEKYEIHPLVIEDIFNTQQRPKIDFLHNFIFLTLRSYGYDQSTKEITSEQISLIIGKNFVLTFQETANETFCVIQKRLELLQNLIHTKSTDYLAYTLIDVVVDGYFKIAEQLGDKIENLEEKIAQDPNNQIVREIHVIKREIIYLRKSIWPLREVLSGLQNHVSAIIKPETIVYLKDVYDHTVQIIDTVETYRDFLASILDIYLSSISNKMNEVMKVLTVFASIFIPLTFITSLYGMNFNTATSSLNMPELNWRYGYLLVWGAIIVVTTGMLAFFKRKKWW